MRVATRAAIRQPVKQLAYTEKRASAVSRWGHRVRLYGLYVLLVAGVIYLLYLPRVGSLIGMAVLVFTGSLLRQSRFFR
jgi:hypothetical protein